MSPGDSFTAFLEACARGDESAAFGQVLERFAGRMRRLAEAQLADPLQAKVDAEDILQSVLRSFLVHQRQAPFHLTGWDNLWHVLALLVVRRCRRWQTRFLAARRDVRREVLPLDAGVPEDRPELADPEPGPEDAACLIELVEGLMRGLRQPWERDILALHLQGFTLHEISTQVGRSVSTVRRVLGRVRRRAQRWMEE